LRWTIVGFEIGEAIKEAGERAENIEQGANEAA